MNPLEDQTFTERLVQAFETGYPNLSLDVSWREGTKPSGVWTATVRTRDGGQTVATGVRHHQALAVGEAMAGIPDRYRRQRHA